MSDPFGAHHHPFGKRTDVGSGTASYFGNSGDGQETNNPFAFVGNALPMSQGVQQNFINPPSVDQPPAPLVDNSNTAVSGTMSGETQWPPSDTQQSSSFQVATNDNLSQQCHSIGSLNVTTTTGNDIFISKLAELEEDPFDSLSTQQPRSNSSQAQHSDDFVGGISRGSSSAPVTGLLGSSHHDNDGDSLDETATLSKLLSLPSSSGSLNERPPQSTILPPPSDNTTMTNAALPNSQCLPVVHSFPYLHVLTNATNADTGIGDSTTSQHSTNAVGYPTSEEDPSLMKSASDVVTVGTAYSDGDKTTSNVDAHTEKEYITLARDKMLATAIGPVDSLASSLNQSMSSLLESQEDITQQSPVQILPPAPETQPIVHIREAPVSPPSSLTTHEPGGVMPTVDMQSEIQQKTHESPYSDVVSDALPSHTPSQHQYSYAPSSIPDAAASTLLQPAVYSNTQSLLVNTPPQTNSSLNKPHSIEDTNPVHVASSVVMKGEVLDPSVTEPNRRISQPNTPHISPMVPSTVVPSVVQPQMSSEPPHSSSVVQPLANVTPVVQPQPQVSPVVQPSAHVSSVIQPSPHVSSVVQPQPQVSPVVQPSPHVSSVVQPQPQVSPVVQPSAHVSSVIQPSPQMSSVVQPLARVPSVQTPPQLSSVVQTLPQVSSVVYPPSQQLSSVIQPSPQVSSVIQPSSQQVSSVIQPSSQQVSSVVQTLSHVSATTAVPFEERTNASTQLTTGLGDAAPQTHSNITAAVNDGSLPHQQDSPHSVIVSQSLSADRVQASSIQSHHMIRPLHVSQASIPGNESIPVTQNVKNVSNPPLLPPQDSSLSNAHQPGILSNAHHYSQPPPHLVPSNAHQPPVSIQGVLSNAHLHQYTPQSLVTGAHQPPSTAAIKPSQPVATQPIHSEQVSTAVNTFTVPPAPVLAKLPHPQDVAINQVPITNNLPSTPDSVFAHSTTDPPLAMSNAVTGAVIAAATGLTHHHPNQSQLLPSSSIPNTSGVPSTPPKVHLTQPHNIGISTQIHPFQTSTSFSSTMTHVQVTSSLRESSNLQRPGITSHVPYHQHIQSNTNAVPSNTQSLPTSSRDPSQTGQHSGAVPPTQQVTSSIPPPSGVHYQPPLHSTVSAPSSVPSSNNTTTQSVITPQVDQREVSTSHTRHTGEQHVPPSHYPLPPSTSRHHRTTEHPITSHPHHGYSGSNRLLRHNMTEIHHRDQYSDHYYTDDPYRSDRYAYDDPYYADHYRERPSSRAPYRYPRGHFEHDPYAAYERYPDRYDPYSGHYYYDPYAYPDPRGVPKYNVTCIYVYRCSRFYI